MVLLAGMMRQTATSTPQYVPFNTSLHAQSTMLACCEIPHDNQMRPASNINNSPASTSAAINLSGVVICY